MSSSSTSRPVGSTGAGGGRRRQRSPRWPASAVSTTWMSQEALAAGDALSVRPGGQRSQPSQGPGPRRALHERSAPRPRAARTPWGPPASPGRGCGLTRSGPSRPGRPHAGPAGDGWPPGARPAPPARRGASRRAPRRGRRRAPQRRRRHGAERCQDDGGQEGHHDTEEGEPAGPAPRGEWSGVAQRRCCRGGRRGAGRRTRGGSVADEVTPAAADESARLTRTWGRAARAGLTAYEVGWGSERSGAVRAERRSSTRIDSEKRSTDPGDRQLLAAAHPVLEEIGSPDRNDDKEDQTAGRHGDDVRALPRRLRGRTAVCRQCDCCGLCENARARSARRGPPGSGRRCGGPARHR